MGNRWFKSIVIIVVAVIATAVGDIWIQRSLQCKASPKTIDEVVAMRMTMVYLPIALDIPGINGPHLVSSIESGIREEDIVIGVVAFGESRAYLRSAFDGGPTQHIVNDKFGSVPVSITHCDRTRCTRVLTSDTQSSINIRCGGWLAVQEMALLTGEKIYPQSSAGIPLIDVPFVVSTWRKWREKHPNSLVYMGTNSALKKISQDIPVTKVN